MRLGYQLTKKFYKQVNGKKTLTPARIGNKKISMEQTKRTDKNELRTSMYNENTNINTSQESINYKTNFTSVNRASSSVGNKFFNSDKKNPIKLTSPMNNYNLNQSICSTAKDKLQEKLESTNRKLSRSIQADENYLKQSVNEVPNKTNVPDGTNQENNSKNNYKYRY